MCKNVLLFDAYLNVILWLFFLFLVLRHLFADGIANFIDDIWHQIDQLIKRIGLIDRQKPQS